MYRLIESKVDRTAGNNVEERPSVTTQAPPFTCPLTHTSDTCCCFRSDFIRDLDDDELAFLASLVEAKRNETKEEEHFCLEPCGSPFASCAVFTW